MASGTMTSAPRGSKNRLAVRNRISRFSVILVRMDLSPVDILYRVPLGRVRGSALEKAKSRRIERARQPETRPVLVRVAREQSCLRSTNSQFIGLSSPGQLAGWLFLRAFRRRF